jgi:hypothetical protein
MSPPCLNCRSPAGAVKNTTQLRFYLDRFRVRATGRTDYEREYAYDRKSHVGKLDKALDEANAKGWTVADMNKDWKKIFAFEK